MSSALFSIYSAKQGGELFNVGSSSNNIYMTFYNSITNNSSNAYNGQCIGASNNFLFFSRKTAGTLDWGNTVVGFGTNTPLQMFHVQGNGYMNNLLLGSNTVGISSTARSTLDITGSCYISDRISIGNTIPPDNTNAKFNVYGDGYIQTRFGIGIVPSSIENNTTDKFIVNGTSLFGISPSLNVNSGNPVAIRIYDNNPKMLLENNILGIVNSSNSILFLNNRNNSGNNNANAEITSVQQDQSYGADLIFRIKKDNSQSIELVEKLRIIGSSSSTNIKGDIGIKNSSPITTLDINGSVNINNDSSNLFISSVSTNKSYISFTKSSNIVKNILLNNRLPSDIGSLWKIGINNNNFEIKSESSISDLNAITILPTSINNFIGINKEPSLSYTLDVNGSINTNSSITANSFSGDGSGLTNINLSSVSIRAVTSTLTPADYTNQGVVIIMSNVLPSINIEQASIYGKVPSILLFSQCNTAYINNVTTSTQTIKDLQILTSFNTPNINITNQNSLVLNGNTVTGALNSIPTLNVVEGVITTKYLQINSNISIYTGGYNYTNLFSINNTQFNIVQDRNISTSIANVGIGLTNPAYPLHVMGKIYASDSVISFSDSNMKTNIEKIKDSLNIVKKLRGVKYTKIDTNENQIGVIAQEVKEVLPEVVYSGTDGLLSVSYGNMVGVLIEAIKELTEKVENLERRLNANI